MLNAVITGGVEFEDVERTLLVECLARLTLSASLSVGSGCHAVDGFGEDTRTSGLSNTTWSAEQVGMSQLSALYGILQGGGKRLLTYDGIERHRTVFSR